MTPALPESSVVPPRRWCPKSPHWNPFGSPQNWALSFQHLQQFGPGKFHEIQHELGTLPLTCHIINLCIYIYVIDSQNMRSWTPLQQFFEFESSVFKFIVRPSKSALAESPTVRKISSSPSYIGNHCLSSPVSEFWLIRTIHIPMHKTMQCKKSYSCSYFFVFRVLRNLRALKKSQVIFKRPWRLHWRSL